MLVAVALLAWGLSGFYRVEPDEEGIVLTFGKFTATTQSGLNYHIPYPIQTVLTPKVTTQNSIEIGMRSAGGVARSSSREVPQESLMLTGDGNIVDVNFSVVWVIKPADGATGRPSGAANYLFKMQNPEGTIKAVAESAMREVVGRSRLQQILTEGTPETDVNAPTGVPGAPPVEPVKPKENVQSAEVTGAAVRDLMQKTLDTYESGVDITHGSAAEDRASGRGHRGVPRGAGGAGRPHPRHQRRAGLRQPRRARGARRARPRPSRSPKASRRPSVADAQGQASRFSQVVAEYKKAPDVTRERLFLETMERVFGARRQGDHRPQGRRAGRRALPAARPAARRAAQRSVRPREPRARHMNRSVFGAVGRPSSPSIAAVAYSLALPGQARPSRSSCSASASPSRP